MTEVIGGKAGFKPNKIYFNVADKSFYKFNGKSFSVIDIAEFQ